MPLLDKRSVNYLLIYSLLLLVLNTFILLFNKFLYFILFSLKAVKALSLYRNNITLRYLVFVSKKVIKYLYLLYISTLNRL